MIRAYLNVITSADTYSLIPLTNTLQLYLTNTYNKKKLVTNSEEIFKNSKIWANSNENWIGQKQYCRRSTF